MPSRWRVALLLLLAVALATVASCGDDDAPGDASGPATSFTWETTLDRDGFGYVLTVDGVVGDGHAAYTMHVEPLLGEDGGDVDDLLAALATAAVNGFDDEDGVATSGGDVSLDGETEVRVLGDERWYRNPWLLDEASSAMGDAEWVRVRHGEPVIADLATAVLNERYDHALRRLLAAVEAAEPLEAPTAEEQGSELDEILTPWVGLAGPAYPIGAGATVTGDADEGEASWRQVLTAEEHGADGAMSGTVRWAPATAEPPTEPAPAVDVEEISRSLG